MEFPANSQKATKPAKPQEKEKVEKVVSGTVVQRKKPIGRRFKELFLGGDAKSASNYVVMDVLVPAFKNMVWDALSQGSQRMIFGDSSSRRRSPLDASRPRVSYQTPVDRSYSRERGTMLPGQPPVYRNVVTPRREANEIILASRAEAELVLERLTDIISTYEVASVMDLHDLIGLPTEHVQNKWGWTTLASAEIKQIREGWFLDLPPVEPI